MLPRRRTIGSLDVLLVTHGRAEWLRRCIESLRMAARRSELEARFLVAVNGEDAASSRVLSELGTTHVVIEATTPADARNRLLGQATSEWICFVDDDAFVEPDYFERFSAAARRNPDALAIGGPNLTPPGASRFARAVGDVLACRFATYTSSARYVPLGAERACDDSALILCNLFIRRSALLSERFPARIACAEENWLLSRLRSQGGLLVYSPELGVYHERREGVAKLSRQVFKYGRGRGQKMRLQPGTARLAHLLPAACVAYSASISALAAAGAPFPRAPALAPYALYAILCALFAASRPRGRILALGLFPLIHVCYGIGVIAGLCAPSLGAVEAPTAVSRGMRLP